MIKYSVQECLFENLSRESYHLFFSDNHELKKVGVFILDTEAEIESPKTIQYLKNLKTENFIFENKKLKKKLISVESSSKYNVQEICTKDIDDQMSDNDIDLLFLSEETSDYLDLKDIRQLEIENRIFEAVPLLPELKKKIKAIKKELNFRKAGQLKSSGKEFFNNLTNAYSPEEMYVVLRHTLNNFFKKGEKHKGYSSELLKNFRRQEFSRLKKIFFILPYNEQDFYQKTEDGGDLKRNMRPLNKADLRDEMEKFKKRGIDVVLVIHDCKNDISDHLRETRIIVKQYDRYEEIGVNHLDDIFQKKRNRSIHHSDNLEAIEDDLNFFKELVIENKENPSKTRFVIET
tara:strand:- start:2469 stop:3509 length:1041 start_codon:yes stop_codon:yes gene_type:complete